MLYWSRLERFRKNGFLVGARNPLTRFIVFTILFVFFTITFFNDFGYQNVWHYCVKKISHSKTAKLLRDLHFNEPHNKPFLFVFAKNYS